MRRLHTTLSFRVQGSTRLHYPITPSACLHDLGDVRHHLQGVPERPGRLHLLAIERQLRDQVHGLVRGDPEALGEERVLVGHVQAQVAAVVVLAVGVLLPDLRLGRAADGGPHLRQLHRLHRHHGVLGGGLGGGGLRRALVEVGHGVHGRGQGRGPLPSEAALLLLRARLLLLQRRGGGEHALVKVGPLLAGERLVALPGLQAVALIRAASVHALGNARVGAFGVRRRLQDLRARGHDAIAQVALDVKVVGGTVGRDLTDIAFGSGGCHLVTDGVCHLH
mmetsp:Transcript_8268/g.17056  ORF Transcript_8268/g.17056 Transcript_8268/m.17056 type:complete len:279 (+) Transcript_8268:161-997(+)